MNCFRELLLLFTNHIPSCDLIEVTRVERLKPHIAYAAKIPSHTPKVSKVQKPLQGLEEDDNEEDEWEYQDENDIYLRSKFFESWLWKSINLPAQADRDG